MPLYLMFARDRIELLPEVDILDGLLVGGEPALALQGVDPLRDAILYVDGVGVDPHVARPRQGLERADDRHQLHAVVGGRRLAAEELLLLAAEAQDRAPAAGAGIAAAGAVAVDLDGLLTHGGACAPVETPAQAPAGAHVPPARPA